MTDPTDRSVDIALAEFNALRAEILAHTASQNALLGLGLTAIGVIVGLAIADPSRGGLLLLVPVLCSVLLIVYAGLAYRIVVAGSYVRSELWGFLRDQCPPGRRPPSWERSLALVESRRGHRWRASIVEAALCGFLLVVGLTSAVVAMLLVRSQSVTVVGAGTVALVLGAALTAVRLGRRAALDPHLFGGGTGGPPPRT